MGKQNKELFTQAQLYLLPFRTLWHSAIINYNEKNLNLYNNIFEPDLKK